MLRFGIDVDGWPGFTIFFMLIIVNPFSIASYNLIQNCFFL